jgi:hypothetical protein
MKWLGNNKLKKAINMATEMIQKSEQAPGRLLDATAKNTEPVEPVDIAFMALRQAMGSSTDPLAQSTAKHLWRNIVARNAIQEWVGKIEIDPKFCMALHRAVPEHDPDVLEVFRTISATISHNPAALYILALVNERLARRQFKAEAAPTNVFPKPAPRENYDGFVCAGIQSPEGQWISGTQEHPGTTTPLPPESQCRLAVWMQPDQPAGAWADSVLVETGVEEDIVSFSFEVDCATLHLPYGRKRVRFHRRQKSELILFDFMTPKEKSEHAAYVHVFQDARLVKSLLVVLNVGV